MLSGSVTCDPDADQTLHALSGTALADLPTCAWEVIRAQVIHLLGEHDTD